MTQNIVLITCDSVRTDHCSVYDPVPTTPYLESLGDEGVVFEEAYCSGVGTPASMTGVFTGQHATGDASKPDPDHWRVANADRTLLPERLQAAGYHTGAFHYNTFMSAPFGWDRGWDVFRDHVDDGNNGLWARLSESPFLADLNHMISGTPADNWRLMWDEIAKWVRDAPEPWFLWVLLMDAHHPYYADPEDHRWPQPRLRVTFGLTFMMRRWPHILGQRHQDLVRGYNNGVYSIDRFIKKLDGLLTDEGYEDRAMLIHGDHGEELGEHGIYGHPPKHYQTLTHVPLVMHGVGQQRRVNQPVSLLDLGGTICDLADIEPHGNSNTLLPDPPPTEPVVRNWVDGDERVTKIGEETRTESARPGVSAETRQRLNQLGYSG